MDKQDKCNQAQPEPVDASRRELLGKAGKAAWVTPTLVFLSFTAGSANAGGGPPDPPSACLPNCPTESTPVNPEGAPTRKPRRD